MLDNEDDVQGMSKYVHACTWYVLIYSINCKGMPCISGFCRARRDATMCAQQPSAGPGSEDGDHCDPCPEGEEFFKSGLDADVME